MEGGEGTGYDADVVVIGGGFAGLVAARTLADALPAGSRIVLLEARERVGGRAFTASLSSVRVDMGAEWFHPALHCHVAREVEAYGAAFQPSEGEGDDSACKYFWADGSSTCDNSNETETDGCPVPHSFSKEFRRVMAAINEDIKLLSPQLDSADPSEDYFKYDIPYFEYVMKLGAQGPTQDFLLAQGFAHSGAGAGEVSALSVLLDICAFGSAETAFCAPLSRIDCGAGGLADLIAEDLARRPSVDIRLQSVVTRVAATGTGTVVDYCGGSLLAHYAIVAVPLNVLGDIIFHPQLDIAIHEASFTVNIGACYKYWAKVTSPPPLEFDQTMSPTNSIVESYLRRCEGSATEYVCAGFSLQDYTADDSVHVLAAELGALYGPGGAVCPNTMLCHDWVRDPFSRGTWLAIRAGRAKLFVNASKKLLCPLATILDGYGSGVVLAGGDLSAHWHGWVEGAIESGIAAAQHVLVGYASRSSVLPG
jgi:monoamine oxidase